ncbi:hypothetical protein ElyMa_004612100 [Elysia marginata]|uniref:Uncharacterized protein n=1 Tax=Elysia marginata TaxID=1093978 RepID=A0AAV4I0Y3_9GAST|nr:hypothetical protein ElyMa_004612100 [Elysia marginata]
MGQKTDTKLVNNKTRPNQAGYMAHRLTSVQYDRQGGDNEAQKHKQNATVEAVTARPPVCRDKQWEVWNNIFLPRLASQRRLGDVKLAEEDSCS